MSAPLHGRVALIMGGSRGIGAAISRRMAADGASLAIVHLSRSAEADELAQELQRAGTEVLVLQADLADPVCLADAVDRATDRFGRVDILVNNAGLAVTGPLDDYPADAFDRVFAVNVRAPFLAAQKLARQMPEGGRIITIGSIVADRMPGAGGSLYAASKSALGGLTRGLARDLGSRGITVNLVQPTERRSRSGGTEGPTRLRPWSPISPRMRRPS
jgi:3-oxoacyl-[acyl-carrier protein] reductase